MKKITNIALTILSGIVLAIALTGMLVVWAIGSIIGYLALLHEWAEVKMYGDGFDNPYDK
tara:strand:- start:30901 stop:31080 length:180 start_codon:yes stop_codon:yes gene_type:complete